MAAIRQAVAKGYRYYLVATTPEEKVLGAVAKINERHRILLSPEARRARREAGLPVASLFLGPEPRGGVWPYALLATKRLEGETMRSVEGKYPLTWVAWRKSAWLPTYELKKSEDTGGWTWFLVEPFYRELLEEAIHYTRTGNWPKLVAHLKTLANLPMFGGFSGRSPTSAKGCKPSGGTPTFGVPTGSGRAPPGKQPWRTGQSVLWPLPCISTWTQQ